MGGGPFGGLVTLGGVVGVGGEAVGHGLDDVVAGDPADDLVAVFGEDGESVGAVADQLAQGVFEGFVGEQGLGGVHLDEGSEVGEAVGVEGGRVWAFV